ncbi:astakine-like isoform X2 [Frieseomelitta varia]|uniref:astakine-like isoform X2 n=1 Tax=Frieseomelitta varia TaxID=561572 RepID=UPI001CB6A63C|nr:astakine-like isoform X2 [Frieseomelitta varia]
MFVQSQRAKITMMTPIFVLSVFLFALAYLCNAQANELDYTYCQSNSECQPGYCCTIGPIRYSIPQCRPMQEEGDTCRPASASTINMTVGYPDGSELTLNNVHYILCPCADELSCDVKEGVCREISKKRDTNRLSAKNKKQDD